MQCVVHQAEKRELAPELNSLGRQKGNMHEKDFAPECNRVQYALGREEGTCTRVSCVVLLILAARFCTRVQQSAIYAPGREEGTCTRVIQVKRLACPESSDPHHLLADLIFYKTNYVTAHFEGKK